MDETTLIETVSTELASQLSAPVRTTGFEDEWPLPVVVIDDWDTTDITFHNSTLAHEEYRDFDGDGTAELARWHRFYFETRVEFLIRHDDEVKASQLQDELKVILRSWQVNPQSFHDDCNRVRPERSANPRHQFREPTETELHASASFFTFYEMVTDDHPTIEEITENITTN